VMTCAASQTEIPAQRHLRAARWGCRDRWPSSWRARRNRLFMRCTGSRKRLRDAYSSCVVVRGCGRRVAPLAYLESLMAAVVLSR
jgi:hypothetical protein